MIMEGFGFYAIKLDMEIPKGDALEVFDSGLLIFYLILSPSIFVSVIGFYLVLFVYSFVFMLHRLRHSYSFYNVSKYRPVFAILLRSEIRTP
jgi:hypothetical protein